MSRPHRVSRVRRDTFTRNDKRMSVHLLYQLLMVHSWSSKYDGNAGIYVQFYMGGKVADVLCQMSQERVHIVRTGHDCVRR